MKQTQTNKQINEAQITNREKQGSARVARRSAQRLQDRTEANAFFEAKDDIAYLNQKAAERKVKSVPSTISVTPPKPTGPFRVFEANQTPIVDVLEELGLSPIKLECPECGRVRGEQKCRCVAVCREKHLNCVKCFASECEAIHKPVKLVMVSMDLDEPSAVAWIKETFY